MAECSPEHLLAESKFLLTESLQGKCPSIHIHNIDLILMKTRYSNLFSLINLCEKQFYYILFRADEVSDPRF